MTSEPPKPKATRARARTSGSAPVGRSKATKQSTKQSAEVTSTGSTSTKPALPTEGPTESSPTEGPTPTAPTAAASNQAAASTAVMATPITAVGPGRPPRDVDDPGNDPFGGEGPGPGIVRADRVEISQGGAERVEATSISITQGGIGQANAASIDVHQGGIGRASATDIAVSSGGIGIAQGERVSLEMGGMGAGIGGEVRVTQSMAGFVAARADATVDQSLVSTLIADRVTMRQPSAVLVLIARQVDGSVRPLLDWRGALAAGAVAGIVLGLFRLGRR